MSALRVCTVYPDLLGTYGDGGNGEIVTKRALWRGSEAELLLARSDESLPEAEIYCIGGGEDGPQVLAAQRLIDDGELTRAVKRGAVILAVCAGFQILGTTFPDASGAAREGLGLLDMTTRKGEGPRAVGELVAECTSRDEGGLGLGLLSGFENHGGVSLLESGVTPLARVLPGRGVGNRPGDGVEGAISGRIIGTYLHGPLLARNPELADQLLRWAMGQEELSPLDDTVAVALREERIASFRTR